MTMKSSNIYSVFLSGGNNHDIAMAAGSPSEKIIHRNLISHNRYLPNKPALGKYTWSVVCLVMRFRDLLRTNLGRGREWDPRGFTYTIIRSLKKLSSSSLLLLLLSSVLYSLYTCIHCNCFVFFTIVVRGAWNQRYNRVNYCRFGTNARI